MVTGQNADNEAQLCSTDGQKQISFEAINHIRVPKELQTHDFSVLLF